jgi:hypothetical protein
LQDSRREAASIVKLLEFSLIPAVQILTSKPLRNFIGKKN